jgi:hypothetical protein
LKVWPSQEYVDLVLFGGSFWRHWTATVLKLPVKAVCSASTTEPLATKLYISACLLLLMAPGIDRHQRKP